MYIYIYIYFDVLQHLLKSNLLKFGEKKFNTSKILKTIPAEKLSIKDN